MTFKISRQAAEEIKAFLDAEVGRPLYIKPGEFAEQALLREITRLRAIIAGESRPDPPDLPINHHRRALTKPPSRSAEVR